LDNGSEFEDEFEFEDDELPCAERDTSDIKACPYWEAAR
jgi:hypothetical protein